MPAPTRKFNPTKGCHLDNRWFRLLAILESSEISRFGARMTLDLAMGAMTANRSNALKARRFAVRKRTCGLRSAFDE